MQSTAQLLKALSEEIRLRIIHLLGSGELCVCELIEILQLPQSTVSRHLAYLRNCGLISDRRDGVWMYYRIAEPLTDFQKQLLNMLQAQLAGLTQGQADLQKLANRHRTAPRCCDAP